MSVFRQNARTNLTASLAADKVATSPLMTAEALAALDIDTFDSILDLTLEYHRAYSKYFV